MWLYPCMHLAECLLIVYMELRHRYENPIEELKNQIKKPIVQANPIHFPGKFMICWLKEDLGKPDSEDSVI